MIKIVTEALRLKTKGDPDLINITDEVRHFLVASKLKNGTVTVFVVGSTAGITTLEYEPGLVADLRDLYEKIIPRNKGYQHDQTWGDANGFSHLRATLTGPFLAIPFKGGELVLGRWQQIVLAEFDNRPRQREIVVQLMGE
jgi:secondary thiamine-phosphate synthase enzyme